MLLGLRFASALIAFSLLASCVPAGKAPLDTVIFHRNDPAQHRALVIFLPGRGSAVRSFEEEGLVRALLQKNPALDIMGVEAHLGYYRDRSLPLRLKEDVIAPARKLGYRSIWLVGVSMGGLGALFYDTTYPGDVTGICLLAPYLGEGTALEEIDRAGGLARWQPDFGDHDVEHVIWQAMTPYASAEKSAGRVYLGYGTSDRFATTNRFFGKVLPAGQVFTAEGGHDWQTWRALWALTLERANFDDSGPAAGAASTAGSVSGPTDYLGAPAPHW